MGLVTALFHDAGYIREESEADVSNGAVFTRSHVSRGARYLGRYLPQIGLAEWVPVATRIIHFTGYEVPFDDIRVADPRDRKVGHLLGTADLLAQMSDRCYLEKCRDRLYAEFVLGDVAVYPGTEGLKVNYGSGLDLLRQTPHFVRNAIEQRLEAAFDHAYRHMEPVFDGRNPYTEAIRENVSYLKDVMRTGQWRMLRRTPARLHGGTGHHAQCPHARGRTSRTDLAALPEPVRRRRQGLSRLSAGRSPSANACVAACRPCARSGHGSPAATPGSILLQARRRRRVRRPAWRGRAAPAPAARAARS